MKISVLIHGPLRSFGAGKNKTLMGFDCHETIKKNIAKAKQFGHKVLVSLSYSSISKGTDNIGGGGLYKFDCTTIFFDTNEIIEPDNRNKQRLGLLNALDKMSPTSNYEIVLVIRTDMLLPETFWRWLEKIQLTNNFFGEGGIVVSELCKEPFYLGDFLLISKVERIREILEYLVTLSSTPIHPISNCELGLSALCGDLSRFTGFSSVSQFWRYIKLRHQWIIFGSFIRTPPREIYARILWRGLPLEEILDLNTFQFKNSSEPIEIEKSYLQLLLSFNYFNARFQKAKGKHFSAVILVEKLRHKVTQLIRC